ncbi:hypothetical protein, partial [Bradyrhizobium canariense]|uniref:hypothetical protein n=1 Tax=Bradyrhizobium canariense TaxID=255045 RepID=UPI001AECD131
MSVKAAAHHRAKQLLTIAEIAAHHRRNTHGSRCCCIFPASWGTAKLRASRTGLRSRDTALKPYGTRLLAPS